MQPRDWFGRLTCLPTSTPATQPRPCQKPKPQVYITSDWLAPLTPPPSPPRMYLGCVLVPPVPLGLIGPGQSSGSSGPGAAARRHPPPLATAAPSYLYLMQQAAARRTPVPPPHVACRHSPPAACRLSRPPGPPHRSPATQAAATVPDSGHPGVRLCA